MKSDDIKAAALKYFAVHGYEGASLSQIADEVGMKKQSLYAHFKGKDDLFMQVLRDAKETEMSFTLPYFNRVGAQNPEELLHAFLRQTVDLFQKDEQLKFWLRVSFFPPAHLAEAVGKEFADTEEKVRAVLQSAFQRWSEAGAIADIPADTPALAFMGILDSLMLSLVYDDDEKKRMDKLEALWTVFWRGISHR